MTRNLNIGCGMNYIDDKNWINCDNSIVAKIRNSFLWNFIILAIKFKIIDSKYLNYPKLKIVDIRKKLPFSDGSIDHIYCSQVVEHLYKYELILFLKECKRILKKGAILRILTPDLDKLVFLYRENALENFKRNDHLNSESVCDHFNLFFYPRSYVFKKKRTLIEKFLDNLAQQHKFIYNFNSISEILFNAGFVDYLQVDTLSSTLESAKKLDGYQEVSLMIEVRK